MVPKRSQSDPKWVRMASRWPLDTRLRSETLPKPNSTAKLRPFWSQNWSKTGLEATKNRKKLDSETDFEFDIIFSKIFEKKILNFDAKIDQIWLKF